MALKLARLIFFSLLYVFAGVFGRDRSGTTFASIPINSQTYKDVPLLSRGLLFSVTMCESKKKTP